MKRNVFSPVLALLSLAAAGIFVCAGLKTFGILDITWIETIYPLGIAWAASLFWLAHSMAVYMLEKTLQLEIGP